MLERGRTDDQDPLNIAQLVQKTAGGNSLHGFAQAHIVGQHRPAAKGQVHRPLLLVGVERGGEDIERAMTVLDLL